MSDEINILLNQRKKRLEELIQKAGLLKNKILIHNIFVHIELANLPKKLSDPTKITISQSLKDDMLCQLTLIDEKAHNDMCCLTQAQIVNKFIADCGHAFEEEAIIIYMKKNKECPVAGCHKVLQRKKANKKNL